MNISIISNYIHVYLRSVYSNCARLIVELIEEKYLSFKTSFRLVEFPELAELFIIKRQLALLTENWS